MFQEIRPFASLNTLLPAQRVHSKHTNDKEKRIFYAYNIMYTYRIQNWVEFDGRICIHNGDFKIFRQFTCMVYGWWLWLLIFLFFN